MSIVYLLYADLAEREFTQFYIPASELDEKDHELLLLASEPICDDYAKEYILETSFSKWWEYSRTGPQKENITHTYCIVEF